MIKEVVIKGMKLYVVPNSAIFVSKKQVEQMKYQEQAKVDNIRELMEEPFQLRMSSWKIAI